VNVYNSIVGILITQQVHSSTMYQCYTGW